VTTQYCHRGGGVQVPDANNFVARAGSHQSIVVRDSLYKVTSTISKNSENLNTVGIWKPDLNTGNIWKTHFLSLVFKWSNRLKAVFFQMASENQSKFQMVRPFENLTKKVWVSDVWLLNG
jgi:hypothetical protein